MHVPRFMRHLQNVVT